MMKLVITSFAIVFLLQDALAVDIDSNLCVRWGVGLNSFVYGKEFYHDIPHYLSEALALEWDLVIPPANVMAGLITYSNKNRQLSAHYDPDTYTKVGMQIAIPIENITNSIYDFVTQGYTSWTVDMDGESKDFWVTQMYFIDESTLEKTVEERQEAAETNITLIENAVWVSGFNGEIVKLSSNATDLVDRGFTAQACFPMLGQHYFYSMSEYTTCAADTLFPWFPLVSEGTMLGIGHQTFVTMAEQDSDWNWFDNPGQGAEEKLSHWWKQFYSHKEMGEAIDHHAGQVRVGRLHTVDYYLEKSQIIVPNGPQCLYDLVGSVGVKTLHVYFTRQPWLKLNCTES